MDIFEAIKGRRSVRRYQGTAVSQEQLDVLFEAARWAPSWANSQCWNFVVVRDEETREKLAATLNPENRGLPAVRQAPVLIVACAQKGMSGYRRGLPATDKGDWWFMFDVAKVAESLALPEEVAVVEIMALGYPDEKPIAPPRKALSEFVFHERYGQAL